MISKEDAKEKLKELIDTFSLANKNKEYISGFSEGDIANQFIDPLLYDVLGWKRQDVRKEVNIHKKRADYVLSIGNESKLVLEAKKATVPLMEPEGIQAVSYAYNKKIKFAILTNFKEIKVYHALSRIKTIDNNLIKFEDKSLFRIPYDKLLENFDRLWLLSRESLEKNELSKYIPASVERAYVPIDEHLSEDLLFIRKELSTNLKSLRTELEDSQIDEVVQIFIDRFIFMRSVEDRGLEDKDFLLKIREDYVQRRTDKNLWELLKKEFQRFDEVYNSKLFSLGLLEKEGSFSDELLKKIIKIFYYGREDNFLRYEFNEIPGDLLGNVYEQYLGTILQGTEKRVKLDEGSGKRKKMGIYYTPTYIVDYIIKNTIGEYIKNKTIDEILDVNIVDPACGSGSFLVRAFHELCQNIESKFAKGEKSLKYKTTFQGINKKLNFSEKAQVLKNCIYGVDLDEKAVELAHLNLVLAVLEGETSQLINRKLPRMDENLKNGNSLIDDSSVAGDKAFKWEAQFPDVFRTGGFDVVVGNPPYVRQESIKEIKDYLSNNYETYVGTADLYVYFFEKGIKSLKEGGIFGFIVSNKFARAGYGNKLRDFILRDNSLKQYIDKFDDKVFEEATVDPCIIIVEKSKSKNNNIIYNYSIKINQGDLDNLGWSFGGDAVHNIKDKIQSVGKKIKEFKEVDIYFGLKSGLNEAFIINKTEKDKFNKKSQEIIKPILRGRDIERYNINFKEQYIILAKIGIDIDQYPEIKRHLESNKEALLKRTDYKPKTMKWYNLRSCDYYDEFEKNKIMYPDISQDSGFCWDNNGYFLNDSGHILVGASKYWLAILNSKLIRFYLKQTAYSLGDNGMRLKQIFIKEIPIRIPDKKTEQKIISLVDKMLLLQKQLHEGKPTGNEKERLEQQIKNVDYEIDQEVYNLYGLTKDEIKIVEDSLK